MSADWHWREASSKIVQFLHESSAHVVVKREHFFFSLLRPLFVMIFQLDQIKRRCFAAVILYVLLLGLSVCTSICGSPWRAQNIVLIFIRRGLMCVSEGEKNNMMTHQDGESARTARVTPLGWLHPHLSPCSNHLKVKSQQISKGATNMLFCFVLFFFKYR